MTSDYDHWEQLQQLFHLAEASPEVDLHTLLEAACNDPETRLRARQLIQAFRNSAAAAPATALPPALRRIGPYTIVRLLGAGGIGSVYLGERLVGGALQRVAVKVLSRHAAGPGFTERFAREQHILASLNHANITRMLDAGMADGGEPYLVMEYVDGEHLDTWCDDNKLGIRERLQLFLHVCEPVAYAHRNLVVHLDLKPSNVLVSREDGTVKLLDFGTSKLVQPDSLLTTTVMATPAYASPEQLLNEPVTTVCDVYALGAVLFELLSGKRPNRDSSVALLIERSMKEHAPESLHEAVTPEAADRRALTQTRLRVELGGDLETIVTKCLAARPRDRYATVDALMEDVQRYLAGRPILARPQTTTYRLGKFVRRNRVAVLATSFALTALVGTAGYASWRQAEAVRAGQRALQMQMFMSRLFELANSDYLGKPTSTVPEFLELGFRVLPDFINDSADLRAAQLSLGESMFANDDYANAEGAFSKVLASARAAKDTPTEIEAEAYAGVTAYFLGDAQLGRQLSAHAMSLVNAPGVTPSARVVIETYYVYSREAGGDRSDENVRILRRAVEECHARHLPDRETAAAVGWLAWALNARGNNLEGERLLQENLVTYGREPYAACDLAATYLRLGNSYYVRGAAAESLEAHRQAYVRYTTCDGPEGLNTIEAGANLARDLAMSGQTTAAIGLLQGTLPTWETKYATSSDRFMPYKMLSQAYLLDGQFTKSAAAAEKALAILQSTNGKNLAQQALCELFLAGALHGEHRSAESLVAAEKAVQGYASLQPLQLVERGLAAQAAQLVEQLRAERQGETQAAEK